MGRDRRPYLPGGVFHLTARTIRWEPWFTEPVRPIALRMIAEVVPRSQVRLMAAAIMPTHLHIVVQQGRRHISTLMQPLMRRLAFVVQKRHGLKGPIFWRHYACTHCAGPRHTRNALVYSHLNPVRGGLCSRPEDYPWTTHAIYAGMPTPSPIRAVAAVLDPEPILPLFATGPSRSIPLLREDYRNMTQSRLDSDDNDASATPPPHSPEHLAAVWGDPGWRALTARPPGAEGTGDTPDGQPSAAISLPELARRTLEAEAPGVRLDEIRGRGGGQRGTQLRHLLIRRLHAAGYMNAQVARFLHMSESGVSYALNKVRTGRAR